ncbi:acetyl-CoA carboxylase biotin carboxyl carrier protein [Sphingosinicella sp. CPCC 101087]|uniref:acetyl-CoA carboxylase biotin carboxyl carrier protein n=1 Tax=Sphingosinicella sp. CPCC 101087 TaxID=2497754 RepID=UPI001FB0FFEE|nr:acetyl-CoA carboxylase biotin carboxyl carrier protein [Sphingosinicella sp. CPCC 101087]
MSEDKRSDDAMRVDTGLIRQLADLLAEKDLSEIEVEDGERRVVVKRKLTAAAPAVAAAPVAAAAAPAVAAPAAAPADAVQDAASHPGAVKAPMVGTVYLSSEPGGPPFVSPGATVAAGDTLLIVEAMKVMNAIHAPKAGTVKQVLVQDAQPVEFDQPLVIIE